MIKASCILCSVLGLATGAGAVIVNGGDGTQNTDGTGVGGWDNVGRITGSAPSSVTYLDNNWFITANHVKLLDDPTGVLLGDFGYTINADSWTRITNSTGSNADLVMFRVDENVSAQSIGISSAAPADGTEVTMIGNGLDRYPDLIAVSGEQLYLIKSGSANATKRWGSNTIESDGGAREQTITIDDIDDYSITETLFTDFDAALNEAQGAVWDSGGGVFFDTGSAFELAGIMIEADNLYTVSSTNAVMLTGGSSSYAGSLTYMADLSVYSNQINATTAIPEPSVLMLGSVIAVAGFCIRRIFMV